MASETSHFSKGSEILVFGVETLIPTIYNGFAIAPIRSAAGGDSGDYGKLKRARVRFIKSP